MDFRIELPPSKHIPLGLPSMHLTSECFEQDSLPCFELFRERGAVCKLMLVSSACAYQWVHITASYILGIALTMLFHFNKSNVRLSMLHDIL